MLDTAAELVLRADGAGDPAAWVAEHRDELTERLLRDGAVLVRGLGIADAAAIGRVSGVLSDATVPEREAFARREPLGDEVFSSLAWPPDQPMCMHHELSYGLEFPRLLVMGCLVAPEEGGVTALADGREVLRALPEPIVRRFSEHGWLLTRCYNDLVGVPWQEAFGSTDNAAVEQYCRDNRIEFEWQPDGGLRTRERRSAVLRHPETGDAVWFNQIAFLNESTMDEAVRDYLVAEFGADGLPFNTFSGDGEPVGADVVATINDVYDAATIREPWQRGDLLLVDNIRMAHSREPYEGDREIGLVLAGPTALADCSPLPALD